MGGSGLKNPKICQQSRFLGKVVEELVVANFLVLEPLFLRSGYGQVNVFL